MWCSQTFISSRRYDRLQWGQKTLELPKILDPIECKNMIRYLNATNSEELNNYKIQNSQFLTIVINKIKLNEFKNHLE